MFSQAHFSQGETERSNSSLPPFNNQDLEEFKNYPDSYAEVFQLSEDQSHLIQDLDLSQYSFKREQFYNFNKTDGDGLHYDAGATEELYHNSNDPYFVSGFSTENSALPPVLSLKDGDWSGEGGGGQFYEQPGSSLGVYYDEQTYYQQPAPYQAAPSLSFPPVQSSQPLSQPAAQPPQPPQHPQPTKKLSKWKEKVTKSTEVCVVCGDKSSGWHYNVLACEGCKGFFRRSIARGLSYACKWGGRCEIDQHARKRCQACRLRKCHERGMKAQCVESQEAAQEKARKKRKLEEEVEARNLMELAKRAKTSPAPVVLRPLSPGELELVRSLEESQAELEHPSPGLLRQIDVMAGQEESEEDRTLLQMTQTTLVTVRLIIEATKRLPGFSNLCQADQMALLKESSSESMMIRTARRYDPVGDTIVFSNNDNYDTNSYNLVGLRNDQLFQFCRKVSKLSLDNAEFALLTAISVFSEREGLAEQKKVEQIQAQYVNTLSVYVANNRPNPAVVFGSILNLLVDLRSLSVANHHHCIYLYKMKPHLLHPLLQELWSIPAAS